MGSTPSKGQIPPDDNLAPDLLAVAWVETGLALSILAARLFARGRVARNLGWDDLVIVFAALLGLTSTVLVTVQIHFGLGKHVDYLTPYENEKALELIWLTLPFSTMCACFGKISVALYLLRVIGKGNGRFREAVLWFLMASLFCVDLTLVIVTFVQCSPSNYLWTQHSSGSQGSCWNPNIQLYYGLSESSYSACTDFVFAVFPIFIIWNLQTNLRVKFAIAISMCLGFLATAAAGVKTWKILGLSYPDFSYGQVDFDYWWLTENWAIIIAACIPTLNPLFSRHSYPSKEQRASEDSTASDNPFKNAGGKYSSSNGPYRTGSSGSYFPEMTVNRITTSFTDLRALIRDVELGDGEIVKTTVVTISE